MKIIVATLSLFLSLPAAHAEIIATCVRADSGDSPELVVESLGKGTGLLTLRDPDSGKVYEARAAAIESDAYVTFRGELNARVPTEGEGSFDQRVELSFARGNQILKKWLREHTDLSGIEERSAIKFNCAN